MLLKTRINNFERVLPGVTVFICRHIFPFFIMLLFVIAATFLLGHTFHAVLFQVGFFRRALWIATLEKHMLMPITEPAQYVLRWWPVNTLIIGSSSLSKLSRGFKMEPSGVYLFQNQVRLSYRLQCLTGVLPQMFFDLHFEDSLGKVVGRGSNLNKRPLICIKDLSWMIFFEYVPTGWTLTCGPLWSVLLFINTCQISSALTHTPGVARLQWLTRARGPLASSRNFSKSSGRPL